MPRKTKKTTELVKDFKCAMACYDHEKAKKILAKLIKIAKAGKK